MDIFNSVWLLKMLAKAGTTPQGRMLSLFDVLEDWLLAPNTQLADQLLGSTPANNSCEGLLDFFTTQAKACGAENPAMLAQHIILIARNAALQTLNDPACHSLIHAKKAAQALITAQTQRAWSLAKWAKSPSTYATAAGAALLVGAASMWLPSMLNQYQLPTNIAQIDRNPTLTAVSSPPQRLSADDASKMYARYEQMRNGTCQFAEVLQIPDKDKTIYIENVVGGILPSNLDHLAIAISYLEKVRCNFTPMLMAHSK
jgi:hypothetical protein